MPSAGQPGTGIPQSGTEQGTEGRKSRRSPGRRLQETLGASASRRPICQAGVGMRPSQRPDGAYLGFDSHPLGGPESDAVSVRGCIPQAPQRCGREHLLLSRVHLEVPREWPTVRALPPRSLYSMRTARPMSARSRGHFWRVGTSVYKCPGLLRKPGRPRVLPGQR